MDLGPSLARCLAGLAEGNGRTVVIAGPAGSGKTAALETFRNALRPSGVLIVEAAGNYRDRTVRHATAARIWEEYLRAAAAPTDPDGPSIGGSDVPAWAYVPSRAPEGPPVGRPRHTGHGRAAGSVEPEEFWRLLLERFRGDGSSRVAVLIDDAALVDGDSRDFLNYLSRRARLRPLVLLLVLDSSLPAYGQWEEQFQHRSDVDWVRTAYTQPDPRDTQRVRSAFKELPALTQELLRLAAMLGGTASQVVIGRALRASLSQVAEAMRPAIGANLLRSRADRLALSSESWIPLVLDTMSEEERREMHGKIAGALEALYPEPSLDRRLEIAEHLFGRSRDADAMRALAQVGEALEREGRIDEAEACLARAIICAAGQTSDDRLAIEAGLRVGRCRLLFLGGRIEEAEREFRESMSMAVLARVPRERLEELMESLLPALRVVGPRPTLFNDLAELADRFHDADALAAETLAILLVVEFDLQRGNIDKARDESSRVSRIARALPRGAIQAVALLTVAAPLIDGNEEERKVAAKCIRSARSLLATFRRPDLQLYADEVHARRLAARGERTAAVNVHEQAIQVAVRARLPTFELVHSVGLANLLVEERPDPRFPSALGRARDLADRMGLTGPSVPYLMVGLLEGRAEARGNRPAEAREWWSSVAERRSSAVPMAFRSEAWLRLADLELAQDHGKLAREYLHRLESPEVLRSLRLEWAPWFAELRSRADRADVTEPIAFR